MVARWEYNAPKSICLFCRLYIKYRVLCILKTSPPLEPYQRKIFFHEEMWRGAPNSR